MNLAKRLATAGLLLWAGSGQAGSAPPDLSSLYFAPDVDFYNPFYSSDVFPDEWASIIQFSPTQYLSAPMDQPGANVTGVKYAPNLLGTLYAFDTARTEGLTRDIIIYGLGGSVTYFDGSAAGIPEGVAVDGISTLSDDTLLVSFDVDFSVGGWTSYVGKNEIFTATSTNLINLFFDPTILVDATASFTYPAKGYPIPPHLRVDAFEYVPETGELLLSFDTSGEIAGIPFTDQDILGYDRWGKNRWRKVDFMPEMKTEDQGYNTDLKALAVTLNEKADVVFSDSMDRRWRY